MFKTKNDLSEEIRDLFPALAKIEHLKPAAVDLTGDFVPEKGLEGGGPPDRLGDYRLLLEIVYARLEDQLLVDVNLNCAAACAGRAATRLWFSSCRVLKAGRLGGRPIHRR